MARDIVTVIDLGENEGQPLMVTELMGGGLRLKKLTRRSIRRWYTTMPWQYWFTSQKSLTCSPT